MVIGLISGAMGPFSNAPIDTIKTRECTPLYNTVLHSFNHSYIGLQKSAGMPGQSAFQRIVAISGNMWKEEGVRSFYKGITPRVLRVAPGQAIVFAVYERVSQLIEKLSVTSDDRYSE